MTHAPAPDIRGFSKDALFDASVSVAVRDVAAWTALRAFACIWVVIYHFDGRFSSSLGGILVEKGYLAVDLFFVLSGAVMFHVYGASIRNQSFSWKAFLWKRFARLYPVHFATMIAAIAILYGGALLGFGQAPSYDPVTTIAANLFAIHGLGVLDALGLNYPSWSISAEFAAYAIFPVLAYVSLTCSRGVLVGFGALTYVAMVLIIETAPEHVFPANGNGQKLNSLTYNMSFLRIWPAFFLGVIACRLLSVCSTLSVRASWVGLLGICAIKGLCLLSGQDWAFVMAGAVLVGLLLIGDFKPPQWVTFLGTISYSIYMVHALVEIVVFKGIEVIGGYENNVVPVGWWPIVMAITIMSGYLLWHYVEEPMRRRLTGVAIGSAAKPQSYENTGQRLRTSR